MAIKKEDAFIRNEELNAPSFFIKQMSFLYSNL